MSDPLYTRDILRLATHVPHLTPIDPEDGRAELRSPACGSQVSVAVRMENGRVAALGQSVEACAFGQASAALMGQNAIGRSRNDVALALAEFAAWLADESDNPGSWPGLAVLAPARPKTGRHGAMLLPFRALLAAIDEANARR